MENTVKDVIEEVVNNEENVVSNVVSGNGGIKDKLIGSLLTVAAYVIVKGVKKGVSVYKAKKNHTEPVPVEATEDELEEIE